MFIKGPSCSLETRISFTRLVTFKTLKLCKHFQVRAYHGCQEFKLGGTPWWADGEQGVEARRLVGGLLASLKWSGWEVAGVLDISRQQEDKAIFLLRQAASLPQSQKQGAVCQMVDWACLSFHEADKIR